MCTLPAVKQRVGGKLPHSTQSSAQLCGAPEGWGGVGENFNMEGHVDLWLTHTVVKQKLKQKPTQYGKAAILQLKNDFKKMQKEHSNKTPFTSNT